MGATELLINVNNINWRIGPLTNIQPCIVKVLISIIFAQT